MKKECDYKLEIESDKTYRCAKNYCLIGKIVRLTTSGPNKTSYNQFQCSTITLRQGTLDLSEIKKIKIMENNVTLDPKLFNDSYNNYDFSMSTTRAQQFKQAIEIYQNPVSYTPTTQYASTQQEFKMPENPTKISSNKDNDVLGYCLIGAGVLTTILGISGLNDDVHTGTGEHIGHNDSTKFTSGTLGPILIGTGLVTSGVGFYFVFD